MRRGFLLVLSALFTILAVGCGGSSSSSGTTPVVNDGEPAAVTVTMMAAYGDEGAVADSRSSIPSTMTICFDTDSDNPGYAEGIDCDSDGGVVTYLDPTAFKVAIKRLSLVKSDSTMVDIVPDTGLLSDAEVVDLSSPVQLDISELPQGVYTSYYAEFYYYELTMEIYGVEEQVRIYLSDDDFPAEGSLGNHQGDVKLLNASDVFGFVYPGLAWTDTNLIYTRTDDIQGISTADPETGHMRGLYGNDDFWNSSEYMQGADQDIFAVSQSASGLTIGSEGGTVTITFGLGDTWFFEDFNSNGDFEPCIVGEACSDSAEWSPVFPGISVEFD